jgi:hypothetical protein
MPKATWGDFSSNDIENAESNSFTPYAGPIPPSGVYRFVVKQMKKGESQAGNPKLQTVMELDGSWKPNHKKYDGCPLFDNMPVMKSTAFRVRAFCEAFGISFKEFTGGKILTDENGKVTKLGSAGDPAGLTVYVNVTQRPATDQYDVSIGLNGTGYLPLDDDADEDSDDADDDSDDADDEVPF